MRRAVRDCKSAGDVWAWEYLAAVGDSKLIMHAWAVVGVDAVRVFMYVCMCAHTAFGACLCGQEFAGERAYVCMYVSRSEES